jgi:Transcriptional regulator PadR-like family
MRAEVLKGHLDALLLAALADGPRHGYAVKEALRAGSGGRFDLPTGTVYPGAVPAGARRADPRQLVGGQRSTSSQLPADPVRAACPQPRTQLLAGVLGRRRRTARRHTPMAGTGVSGPRRQPAGHDPVEAYLTAVASRLTGPAAARAAITDELRDGLLEALATHRTRGCSPQEATAAAIEEFGDPPTVAAAFGPELAAVQARRVALGLLVSGPLVGLTWIAAVAVNALSPWRQQLTGPWLALPLVGLALAVACPALGLTVAATGRLGSRLGGRLDRRASFPPTAAAVAGLAAVLADLTLLAIICGQALASPGSYVWAPIVLAVGASLTRVTLASRAARRLLVTRATLT